MLPLRLFDAGYVPYAEAYEWQRALHAARVAVEIPDVLLVLQHPHVVTLGRRTDPSHLLVELDILRRRGIAVHEADRGGSVTYHGPGQVVAYPIVDLRATPQITPDPIAYLRVLEAAIVETCARFGVCAGLRPGLTGVWVGKDKLAAIGVNVSRGVSKHGLALNVSTELEYFSSMIPCGIEGASVTSLERELGVVVPVGEVAGVLGESLAEHLGRTLVRGSSGDWEQLAGGPELPAAAAR